MYRNFEAVPATQPSTPGSVLMDCANALVSHVNTKLRENNGRASLYKRNYHPMVTMVVVSSFQKAGYVVEQDECYWNISIPDIG